MGMQELREELEELAFRHIKPEAHETVTKRLEEVTEREGHVIGAIELDLREKLAASGIAAEVSGRRKRPYSIWKKMERKSVPSSSCPTSSASASSCRSRRTVTACSASST